ncbi:MAG: protein kinase, partial [Planctomycetes bacterium]|nr:protein kinase [Planctomycetota bacterium]
MANQEPGGTADRDPLQDAVDSFMERFRRGERPSIREHAARFPGREEEIREVLSALELIEQVGAEEDAAPAPQEAEAGSAGGEENAGTALRRLGEYRILREVGRGGMGVVYEAVQESLGRRVALKVLPHGSMLEPRRLERFRNEARAVARLHHSNIVPVFGVGEEDGIHFYAMQFIEGRPLDALLLERAPGAGPPGESRFRDVARMGLQVAEALSYAHGQGVLHSDIKPSNLLLDTGGTVWVTDFGLAKAEGTDDITRSGDVLGTLAYMAPERMKGWSDPRSDVYGLGLTLYELLALQPAFRDTDRGRLIKRVLGEEPVRPDRLVPDLPQDLETIVLKAIEKDPARRYASAEEMAGDLRSFLADRPIQARRTTSLERGWRWCRRNPVVAALAAAAAVLLVTAAASLAVTDLLRRERNTAQHLEHEARFWENLHRAQALALSRKPGRVFESRERLRSAAEYLRRLDLDPRARDDRVLELRRQVVATETRVDLGAARRWTGLDLGGFPSLELAPDFERYAVALPDGGVSVRIAAGHGETMRLEGPGHPVSAMRFSGDGRLLAVNWFRDEGGTLRVWDLARRAVALELDEPVLPWAFDLDPPGGLLAAGVLRGGVRIHEVATGSLRKTLPLEEGIVPYALRLDPRGERLAVSTADRGDVDVLELESGRRSQHLPHPAGVRGLAWHPGGELLACACADANVYVWELGSGREPRALRGHEGEVMEVEFSHAGDVLLSGAWDNTLRLWNPHTGDRLLDAFCSAARHALRFSLDDRLLGYSSDFRGEVLLWDVARAPALATLHGHARGNKGPFHVDVSPDGRLLASVGFDGVRLWDLERLLELARLPLEQGERASAVFHPRGGYIVTSGSRGLFRWPLRRVASEGGAVLQVGPPEGIVTSLAPRQLERAVFSAGGSHLAVHDGRSVAVLDLDAGTETLLREAHANMDTLALSPSGESLATGTWQGAGVRVWSTREGLMVAELPSAGSAFVGFSPDGRWLVTGDRREYRFHEVGSWRLRHGVARDARGDLPGRVAFPGDGSVAALVDSPNRIKLLSPETGLELIALESPEPYNVTWLCLSPDGARLAAATSRFAVQVWDLRHVRRQLEAMGLDWGRAPRESPGSAEPLKLEVFACELRDERSARELDELSRALATRPADAELRHERGHAHESLGRLEEALADYGRALELKPDAARVAAHRGSLHARLGRWLEARA